MHKDEKSELSDSVDKKSNHKIGRPVDKLRDLAILKAALELVAHMGYDSVTIDAIATKAHASKATLYRRWKSKPYLIADALVYIMPCEQKVEHEKCKVNLRDYLCELLCVYFGIEDEIRQKVMLSIATAMTRDKLLSQAMKSDCITSHTCAFRDAIKYSVDDNLEAQKLKLIQNLGPALLFYQLISTGNPIEKEYIEHIVDDLIMPLITINKADLRK